MEYVQFGVLLDSVVCPMEVARNNAYGCRHSQGEWPKELQVGTFNYGTTEPSVSLVSGVSCVPVMSGFPILQKQCVNKLY